MSKLEIKEEAPCEGTEGTNKDIHCWECGENFIEFKELIDHRETAHKCYTCMCCTKDETSLVDFEYHLQTHGLCKLFRCIICQETFFSLSDLNNHLPTHMPPPEDVNHEEGSLKESHGGSDIEDNSSDDSPDAAVDVALHEQQGEDMETQPNDTSKKKRKRGRPAKPKVPYSMLERKFKCPYCPLSVKTSTNLKHHLRTHTGEKPYECALCGKSYVQKIALKIHMTMKHDSNKKKTEVCQFCGKTFYFVRRLKNHIREIHTNRERHPCFICGKTYSAKNSVAIHMQTHFKQTDAHPCPKCDRKYDTHVRMMQHHRQAHVNAKQYKCKWEDCEYCTFCPTMLRKHERTHTGEKPYTCKICNKAFSSTTSVNVHISHKHGVPTHQCKLCEKSFKVQDSLKKHIQRIHEERKFPCMACKKKFASNSDAMRHMRDSHSLGKKVKIKD